ncbi:DUF5693 family protein [Ammoniphilus resinae]|uniref:Uncharacterized protein n=1 Tax=Ammoniphilus resinae TaxID=861532 RepID=A0ABS4GJE7_9BACL|nr:DUF5693 family protein [Ammoniphilus resinae]MBP1930349.1 hypothetical protein [Ammoniphilus resinae]
MIRKMLWVIMALSLLSSIPLIADRFHAETSTKAVESVVEDAEILKLTSKVYNTFTEDEVLQKLKDNGVTSIALYELTLQDLTRRGIVNTYSTSDQFLRTMAPSLPQQQSIVLFRSDLSPEEKLNYQTMMKQAFQGARDYKWNNQEALLIPHPLVEIERIFLGIDFNRVKKYQDRGFHIVARINSDRYWNENFLAWQFNKLGTHGVKKMIFEGKGVLGFPVPENMEQTAAWMRKYGMSFGLVDFYEQQGYKTLGKLNDLHTFRVLSISDQKMASTSTGEVADMFSLGIQERNVRMAYLHMPIWNSDQIPSTVLLGKTLDAIKNINQDISAHGYVFKETKPFFNPQIAERGWYNLVLIIGLLSLTSLALAKFHRIFLYLPIPFGLILYAGAQLLHQEILLFQFFALLGAIMAPVLSTILVVDYASRFAWKPWLASLLSFVVASVISLYGAVTVVSLLNNLVFIQYLEQFRGVKLLYFAPIVLIFLYCFRSWINLKNLWELPIYILNRPLYVKHLVLAGIALAAIGYFLSRSGNAATTLPFELEFRQWLDDVMGVRPRTKEIFLGHPFFLLATYMMFKYKKGKWLFILGVIGQMSMVSTFTHIHTPLLISIVRTFNGMLVGAIVGVILILIVEWIGRFLRKRERIVTHVD